ncbi:MAG: O-antigen ligase family protein [Verrucomicrobiota bacterium]
MDYLAVRIVILLWLVRPQDWLSGFGGFQFMQYAMLAAMAGVWLRPQGLQLGMLRRSPMDWLVIFYLCWIVYTTGDYIGTGRALVPYAAFYFCTALALNTIKRLSGFITCWTVGLAIAAIFALSTDWGFELAPGSAALTSSLNGRLALNTWIFNNPNGLGHGMAALIPLAYICFIWKRPFGLQVLGFIMIFLAANTVFLTQSKGAYLSGAAAITITFLFRKPKILQISFLVVALTVGVAAIKLLPRMETLSTQEEGIAGRLMIWQMAYNAMTNTVVGEGWKGFEAWIDSKEYGLFKKATHGSYVNVGADLGYAGLFLFVGIMYACGRALYQTKLDPEESTEAVRCQRALIALLTSFASSAWIIDRAYHSDYFLLAGAIAAFHRLMTMTAEEQAEAEQESNARPIDQPEPGTVAALPWMSGMVTQTAGQLALSKLSPVVHAPMHLAHPVASFGQNFSEEEEEQEGSKLPLRWLRLDLIDLAMMTGAFFAVIFLWERLMTDFISL